MGEPETFSVYRWKDRGPPGEVISESTTRLEGGDAVARKTATATFPVPREYLLPVQALDSSFPSRCRWTDGYVQVRVAE